MPSQPPPPCRRPQAAQVEPNPLRRRRTTASTLRDLKEAKEEVAKYKIDENVQRETINHRSLRHPNIVRFKEVLLTPSHLAIVMEYVDGGELFERIYSAGRFSEAEVLIFLPATDMWSQILSVHGKLYLMQIHYEMVSLFKIILLLFSC
ncbi:putative protein kinase CAMK-OST1L family [Rosa chinensis]|uniref:Protein kinase domain-containing protein n=1 Tax=Rosa chinensis TaxID=74649 RepID=A0A2P6Q881_ROSCH|nr:putative protein kinase CAMK-OST1L family [Rosa chinensis]